MFPDVVVYGLDQIGIKQLYSHQVEATMHALTGKDIFLLTSAASVKSMSYMISILEMVMADPKATALYIVPLNALVNDQLKLYHKNYPLLNIYYVSESKWMQLKVMSLRRMVCQFPTAY